MKQSLSNREFFRLLGTLKQIQFWMEAESPSQIMLATSTAEEFNRQKLPPHCRAKPCRIYGPRVPVRRRKQIHQTPMTSAYWPNDGLIEGLTPMLLFVINGEADLRFSNYRVHCHAEDILFVPARLPKFDGSRPHYEKITADAHCDILVMRADVVGTQTINVHICHSRGKTHTRGSKGEHCLIKGNLLYQLLVGIGDELQNAGQQKSIHYLLRGFIALFQQKLEHGHGFDAQRYPAESLYADYQGPIQEAIHYMQNHLNKPLSIEQISRWIGLSRTAFTMQFRQATNQSFKEYLTQLRLGQAKVLLLQSDLTIERISKQVGLTAGQLRNIFHQEYRCTPREFRQSQKYIQN